jgi:hypothetical protein
VLPTATVLAGVPEIVIPEVGGGAVPPADCTVMEKDESVAALMPSLTAMVILPYLPTLAAVGVPESFPVVPLKVAHEGL